MAAKTRLPELVAANAPVFYLHPGDHYMPCSVEWFSAFLGHCSGPSALFAVCSLLHKIL